MDSDGNIQAMPDDLKDVEIDFDVVTDNVNNLARHLSKKRPKSKQTITFDPTTYERKLSASTFYVPLPDGYVGKYPVACQELISYQDMKIWIWVYLTIIHIPYILQIITFFLPKYFIF